MRAAACDPMPKVLCGWPRSHLLSSMLAVQRLAGWLCDPSSMGLRRSSIHGSVHLAWPRRRWRWMLSKQSSVRARALVQHGGEGADQAWGGVPRIVVLVLARGAPCWPKFGGMHSRTVTVGASEHGWMRGAMCTLRGRGRLSKTVAMSLAREDHTTTPRWRATARIVLFSRGRLVSRIGQKKEKSTTCEPSTLRRGAWSRPSRGQRSACTSSPRRARTARRKWAG